MRIWLASLHSGSGGRVRGKEGSPLEVATAEYVTRIAHSSPIEAVRFSSEADLFAWRARQQARTPILTCLLDSLGATLTSRQFADRIRGWQDQGRQQILFAVGPADGWTEGARAKADLLLSLGPMTLPHELARVVLAEQVYRAFTILAGHPYHSGH